jgi:hypothetical protein
VQIQSKLPAVDIGLEDLQFLSGIVQIRVSIIALKPGRLLAS